MKVLGITSVIVMSLQLGLLYLADKKKGVLWHSTSVIYTPQKSLWLRKEALQNIVIAFEKPKAIISLLKTCFK